MEINKIFVACDYRGDDSKKKVIKVLEDLKLPYSNLEFSQKFSFHFNNPAKSLCRKVLTHKNNYGILLCGSGIGMNIQANKIKGIRSILGLDKITVKLAREVEDVNVLSLRANNFDTTKYKKIIETFFKANFLNEKRHIKRIEDLEK